MFQIMQNPQWQMMQQNGMMPMFNMPMPQQGGYGQDQNFPAMRQQAPTPDQSGNPYAPQNGGGRHGS